MRLIAAGDGYAPDSLPTKPMLAELPPFGARFAFQSTFVACTNWPVLVQFAFQPLLNDSVVAGNENVNVQPSIALGPVFVTESVATYPLPHELVIW